MFKNNVSTRLRNSLFIILISLLFFNVNFAAAQSLCRLTDSFATIKESSTNVDNTCLKTLASDYVFNKSLVYAFDGYGLTSLQLVVIKNSVQSSLTKIDGYYQASNTQGTISFDNYEYVKSVYLYYKNDWLTAIRIFTSKKTVDVGTPGSGDNFKILDINGDLAGLKASSYVNGITSLQFYVVRNCLPDCDTCSTSLDSCDTCKANYYRYFTSSFPTRCYSTATVPESWFIDTINSVAKPCDSTCTTCTTSATNCTLCASGFFKKFQGNNVCYSSKPSGYYLDIASSPYVWKPCDSTCKECEFRSTNCLICNTNCYPKVGLNSNVCFCTRPTTFYLDNNATPKVYKPCNSPCLDCDVASSTQCLTCITNYYFKVGYNVFGDTCYNSAPLTNYVLDTVNPNPGPYWKPCHNGCLTCTAPGILNPTSCLTCNNPAGYYFRYDFVTPATCFNTKPVLNFYLNTSTKLWELCSTNCGSCNSFGTAKCLTCATNYYFKQGYNVSEDECFINPNAALTTAGWYLDTLNSPTLWKQCPSPCATCTVLGGVVKCLSCVNSYYFKEGYNVNGDSCFTGTLDDYYFSNNLYRLCSAGCKSCTTIGDANCNTCKTNYYIKEGTTFPTTCYNASTIGDGWAVVQGVYKACITPCKNCITNDSRKCSACISTFYFQENYDTTNGDICFSSTNKPAENYYLDTINSLYKKCASNCRTCNTGGDTNCLTCASDYYPISSSNPAYKCYFNSPGANYYFANSLWNVCNSACATCTAGTAADCLTCSSNYYFKENDLTRPTTCYAGNSTQNGFYLDTTKGFWRPCTSPCATCSGSSTYCLTCATNYYFVENNPYGNTCFSSAPASTGYYFDGIGSIYRKCPTSCETCNNGNASSCTQCASGYYRTEDLDANSNWVVASYPTNCYSSYNGRYLEKTTGGLRPCPSANNCSTCIKDNTASFVCLSCIANYYLIENDSKGQCLNSAPSGYFLSNSVWKKCHYSCSNCVGSLAYDICNTCNTGYYKVEAFDNNGNPYTTSSCSINPGINYFFDSGNGIWRICSTNCKSCVSYGSDKCNACNETSYYFAHNSVFNSVTASTGRQCYNSTTRPLGLYLDSTLKLWVPCPHPCATCDEGNVAKCKTCVGGYYFKQGYNTSQGDTCYNVQMDGYYLSTADSLYKPCNSACTSCTGGNNSDCLSCNTSGGYYFKNDNTNTPKTCYQNSNRPANHYLDTYWKPCVSPCVDCKTINKCTSCATNYYLMQNYDSINGDKCYNQASLPTTNYFLNASSQWQFCSSNCATCTGAEDTTCNSCAANYFYETDNNNRPKKCFGKNDQPSGKYLDTSDNFWKACNSECATCNMFNKAKCKTCVSTHWFKDGYDSTNGDTCYSSAPSDGNYFKDTSVTPNLWKKCSYNCATCSGVEINKCLTCVNLFFFIENFSNTGDICLKEKPAPNYFFDTSLWKKCHVACATCNAATDSDCLTCSNLYYFQDSAPALNATKKCWNALPAANYYLDSVNSLWKPCLSPCATCKVGDSTKCLTCIAGYRFTEGRNTVAGDVCRNSPPGPNYYLDGNDDLYKLCSTGCATCTAGGADKCTSCASNYYKKSDAAFTNGTTCYLSTNSPAGYYWAVNLTDHTPCGPTCATCSGGPAACMTCSSTYYFKFSETARPGTCYLPPITNFTVATIGGITGLAACDLSCNQCTGSSIQCNACNNNYYPKENLAYPTPCYDIDPAGFYKDTTSNPIVFRACEAKCATCQGTAGFCLSCATNYYYTEDERNNCYNVAPNGYILDDSAIPKLYVKRNILKLNQLEDMTFDEIEPSFSGRYTMEFWMMSSANTLTSGIHFIWRNHVSITILQNPTTVANLNVYCWPRDYLNFNLENTFGSSIPTYQTSLADNSSVYTLTSYGNSWIFIRCAVNYNNRNYYLNVSDNLTNKNFVNERISSNNLNDHTFKYFYQPGEKTLFKIVGGYKNTGTNIYLRTLSLFNEFLPNTMMGYRNYDLYDLPLGKIPYLSMYISSVMYNKVNNQLPYISNGVSKNVTPKAYNNQALELTINSRFNHLCSLVRREKLINSRCDIITTCDNTKYEYCTGENIGIHCKNGMVYDPSQSTPNCYDTCSNSLFRGPTSVSSNYICNVNCDTNSSSCPTLSKTDLTTINTKFTCNTNYSRFNYKCIDDATAKASYMNFNGCFNSANMIMDFNLSSYLINVWIKFDKYNEYCSSDKTLRYYFVAYPHIIYSQAPYTLPLINLDTNFFYFNVMTNQRIKITGLSNFNFNLISISHNEQTKQFRLIINNNYKTPAVAIDNTVPSQYTFSKLMFCANNSKCTNNNTSALLPNEYIWGSAFYKDLRIHNGVLYNHAVYEEKEINLRSLKSFTPNLFAESFYLPLNIFSSNTIDLKSSFTRNPVISFLRNPPYLGNVYYSEIDQIFNYSSKTGVFDLSDNTFISNHNSSTGALTKSDCPANCQKCTDSATCLYCAAGFKNYANSCIAPNNMYLSLPQQTLTDRLIILNVEDANTKYKLSTMDQATVTFSLKILGPLDVSRISNSLSTCITILKLTKDSKRQICYIPSDDSINVLEDTIPVFKFIKFSQYFGRWIQLSLSMDSTYIYNSGTSAYTFNSLLNSNWKNLYAFYVNEIPVVPFKEFNFDVNIHKTQLYFDTLDIGNEFWAYLSELNVYRGFIVNPFISSTSGLLKSYLVRNYNFKNAFKNKFTLIPSEVSSYGSHCLTDDSINLTQYNISANQQLNYNFANTLSINCIADYNPFDAKKCEGNTYIDGSTLYKNAELSCFSCSASCQDGCAFKGINGCSSNLINFSKNYLRYTNYNSADSTGLAAKDVNVNYVYPGVPETKKTTLVDLSKYKSIFVQNINVASSQKYSMEFWYNLYFYGQADYAKANPNTAAQFPLANMSHEFIWDNHMLIRIENINNEINVSCIPIYKRFDKSNSAFTNIMNEYNKNKLTEKQSNMLYRKSKWVYVTCSTNIPDSTFSFNNKQTNLYVLKNENLGSVADQVNNPFNFLNEIKSKTITSTTLSIKTGDDSKSNYGMLFIQELRLWSDSNIKRFSTNCRINISTKYTDLLHYYKFENIFNMVDEMTSTNIAFSAFANLDDQGLNIVENDFDMDTLKSSMELNQCLNLLVSPLSGNADKTVFKLSTYVPPEMAISSNRKYYYRLKDKTQLYNIDNVNFENNIATVDHTFSSSFIKTNQLDVGGYPLIIEFIFGLTDSSSFEWFSLNTISLFSETTFLDKDSVVQQVVTTLANITSNMTTDELISSANLISTLGASDASFGTLNNNTLSNKTEYDTKLSFNNDGSVNILKSVECNNQYCNNQGTCSYADEYKVIPICTCFGNYSGTFCELKNENQVLLKNYTLNIMLAITTKLLTNTTSTNGTTTTTGTTGTSTSTANTIVVTPIILNTVSSQLEQGIKVVDNIKDITVFSNVVNIILDSKSETTVQNVVNSSSSVINMIKNLFLFSNIQVMKTKSLTTKASSASKKTTTGSTSNNRILKALKYLQTSSTTGSTDATTASSTNAAANTNVPLTAEEIYLNNKELILNNENAKSLIFKFLKNYISYFNIQYNKDLNSNNTIANTTDYLRSVNVSQYSIDQSNSNFDLLFGPILDSKTFDFNSFFSNRIRNKLSYIEAKDCVSNYLQSFNFISTERTPNKIINNVAFIAYINFKNPMYIIDNSLLDKSISQSHFMVLYDINGNELNIDNCPYEILHYFPLFPRNNTFVERYNVNPTRYNIDPTNNITSISQKYSTSYMPIYIFPNGTIDKTDNSTKQLEKYYLTYRFNLTEYNIKNLTIYNQPLNIAKMFDNTNQKNQVKYINNGYVVGSSRNLAEFTVMTTYDPPTQVEDKYYFLRNGKIFLDGENWKTNSCFYVLVILLGINYFFVILLMILGCCNPKVSKADNSPYDLYLLKLEYQNFVDDNRRFDNNFLRLNLYEYLQLADRFEKKTAVEMAVDIPKKTNSEPGKNINQYNNVETNKEYVNAIINENQVVLNIESSQAIPQTEAAYEKNNKTTVEKEVKKNDISPSSCNMFFFIFARNLYAAPWVIYSPFSPKWKIMAKVFCLVYLLIFFSTLLFIWSSVKLSNQVYTDYKSLVYIVFVSALVSNAIFSLLNLLYSVFINNNRIIESIKHSLSEESMSGINLINIAKFIIINIFALFTLGGAFYLSFSLEALYTNFGRQLIIVWIFTLIADFVIMEILLEFFIYILKCCKNNCLFGCLLGTMLGIKNLRNAH